MGHDAFVGIVMTHGQKDNMIQGVDEKFVKTEAILENFNNRNCEALIGKPKLFFFQTCRGSMSYSFTIRDFAK